MDVIRASSGNNAKRHLLISGYNTGFDRTCDPLFKMPNDPANRMAISVHYYTPAGFCILEDKDESWAKCRSTWGTDEDYKELNANMDMMKNGYADKGIPVIIGEYGCPTKGKEPASVRKFLTSVVKAAYERGLCPVLWATPKDNERPEDTLSGHYDRVNCKLCDPELKKAFNEITGFTPKEKTTESTTEATTETTTEPTTEATTETTEATTVTHASGKGDVNKDSKQDIMDIIALQKWLLGLESKVDAANSDLNDDGLIDIFDLGLLKRQILSTK